MKWALRGDVMRTSWPPGGWQYVENDTGWKAPTPMNDDYDRTVARIIQHRKQNPGYNLPTDQISVGEALMDQTAKRILEMAPDRAVEWLVPMDDEAKKKSTYQRSSPDGLPQQGAHPARASRVDRILSRIRGVAKGVVTLADWVGDGCLPVSPAVADRRARGCSGCPLNISSDAFGSITGAVAEAIREQMTTKNATGLVTNYEDKLKTCSACGCHLRLKVWVPIETIRDRMQPEDYDALHPSCWVKSEDRVSVSGGVQKRAVERTVTIQRMAAFGDVILSTIIASKLSEIGVGTRLITEPIIGEALAGHPDLEAIVTGGTADVVLDKTYEGNLERGHKDIALLLLEAADYQLRKIGISIPDFDNRVPTLGLTDDERWAAARELQMFPRPWVVVVDGSGSWPNRMIKREQLERLKSHLPDATLIWSKPRGWVPAPAGFCSLDIRNFRHLMGIISLADLVITPDTGPMHIAAAFNRPIVAIEQCNDTHLRLTNLTDYTAVWPPLLCVRCNEFICPIDAKKPPCQDVDAGAIATAAKLKLAAHSGRGVTAIIAAVNFQPRLLRCIDQIVTQVDEVMLVMDGPPSILPPDVRHPKLRIFPSTGARLGYGKTVMRVARQAAHPFLLMLNDDCYLDDGAVKAMLDVAGPTVGAVGCLLRHEDGTIQHGGKFRGSGTTGFGHIDHMKRQPSITEPTDMEAVTFAAALVNRKAFFEVRGYDERFDCYSEDTDLCMKLGSNGWRIVYQPHATGIHDDGSTSKGFDRRKMLEDGSKLFSAKWHQYLSTVKPIF